MFLPGVISSSRLGVPIGRVRDVAAQQPAMAAVTCGYDLKPAQGRAISFTNLPVDVLDRSTCFR